MNTTTNYNKGFMQAEKDAKNDMNYDNNYNKGTYAYFGYYDGWNKSIDRIEPMVALINAMAGAIKLEEKTSVYESRGMRSL